MSPWLSLAPCGSPPQPPTARNRVSSQRAVSRKGKEGREREGRQGNGSEGEEGEAREGKGGRERSREGAVYH